MTTQLERAFAQAAQLSESEQNALAALLLTEIAAKNYTHSVGEVSPQEFLSLLDNADDAPPREGDELPANFSDC